MSTFNTTDLIAVRRGSQTYKAEFGDVNATILTNAAALFPAGQRNVLINGDFMFSRSGTTPITAGPGEITGVNRWVFGADGTGSSRTITRLNNVLGNSFGGLEPRNILRVELTTAGSGTYNKMEQRIEGVRTLSDGQATISFWAKGTSAFTIPYIGLSQYFGTGGSPSSESAGYGFGSFDVTTQWKYFTATTTVGALTGKTLGSNGDNFLRLYIALPTTPFSLDLALMQLERGPIATPFERRSITQERILVERYLEEGGFILFNNYAPSTSPIRLGSVFFHSEKRSVPTITLTTTNAANASSFSVTGVTSDGFTVIANPSAAGMVSGDFSYVASSEL